MRKLLSSGHDIVHTAEVGLSDANDAALFEWAVTQGRLIVTRNYRDFAPLVQAWSKRGRKTPGVLFLATSVPEGNVGAHVRALEAWIKEAKRKKGNPAADSFDWLR